MEYTVKKLGRLAGISPRTLRFYDEIGILTPARTNSSGYRIYGQAEVDRLQQILFYREMGMPLERIKEMMTSASFDGAAALREHREQLLAKREQLDRLIANVERTIQAREGGPPMTDAEKFEGFKRELVAENERKYGEEIRGKYGDDRVNRSNAKLLALTPQQHEELTMLAEQVKSALAEAIREGDPAGEKGRRAAELHKRWLMFHWPEYDAEAHAGLAQMYVDDERFRAYYDQERPGTAEFLRDAILHYIGERS